jgi:periplasmic divalent cation tolerance protein
MKTTRKARIVFVTTPDLGMARKLARKILEARVAACVNLVPRLESHYWWQGKIEKSAEVLLLIKTERQTLRALEKLVLANHPYDTPEFVVLPIESGNERYLAWLGENSAC